MTTHAPMARVPFAPLDNPRLQHLANTKNRQNGISKSNVSNGKPSMSASLKSPTKRPFEPAVFDEYDSENLDPAILFSPSKKSKSDVSDKPVKPFTFTMTPSRSMPPPPSRLSTPARANMSSPRAPSTAPAGRSPTKRKGTGLLNKNRRTSAPFTRIDPPSFSSSRASSSLPFSLDAALSGTFSTSANTTTSAGATIQESMPKSWFFEIYEDTPEEEASNLMEHSTLTLDLSSDDESDQKLKDERGKENMPPEGYDMAAASRSAVDTALPAPARVKKCEIVRKKVVTDEMDDGQRAALAALEPEAFIPEGLSGEAHVIVDEVAEKPKTELTSFFATTTTPFTAGLDKKNTTKTPSPLAASSDEITVWEDSSSEALASAEVSPKTVVSGKAEKQSDENTVPTNEGEVL